MNKSPKPNLVCIIVDDTDFSLLGCYGSRMSTPNIDRIAAEGVRFDGMTCSASVCTPSRYTYLTGHYAGRCPDPHFLAQNPADEPYCVSWNSVLNGTMPSLAQVMGQNSYRTGYAGKWHCGRPRGELGLPHFDPDEDPGDPDVDQRLIEYQRILAQEVRDSGGFDYAASIIWGNNESFPLAKLQEHNLDWITKGALDFLDSCDRDQSFLLYMASTAFHGPPHHHSFLTDECYTQGGKLDAPLGVHPPRSAMRDRLRQAGLPFNHDTVGITWIDDQVGAVLDKLDEMGVTGNTIVTFQIDHNTETGKGTCFQDGVRIPMLMKWPGRIAPGTTCDAVVQNIDFVPTAFDGCGIAPPEGMPLDGTSFLPLLDGSRASIHDDLFLEFGYARAVWTPEWKYIALRYPQQLIAQMENGELAEAPNHINQRLQGQMNIAIDTYPGYFDPDQLYDLKADPGERHNLARDPAYAGVLDDMKRRLQRYLDRFDHPFDLDDVAFLNSARFKALADETRKIGTAHIEWWPKADPYAETEIECESNAGM